MIKRPTLRWGKVNEIIEKVVPLVDAFCPFLMEEPALNPRLPEILGYVKQVNPRCETIIYSNMGAWKPEVIDRIVEEGNLDTLITSLYAPNKELHAKFQPGVDTDAAWMSLKMWFDTRRWLNKLKPRIQWHYLAIPELMDHAQEFVDRVTPISDSGGFTHFDTFHGDVPQMGDNDRYFGEPEKTRRPCPHLWRAFNTLSNGDVVPCCLDYSDSTPLGNIFRDDPETIWRNPLFEKLRQMHVDGRQSEVPLCANCEVWKHQHPKEWTALWN